MFQHSYRALRGISTFPGISESWHRETMEALNSCATSIPKASPQVLSAPQKLERTLPLGTASIWSPMALFSPLDI